MAPLAPAVILLAVAKPMAERTEGKLPFVLIPAMAMWIGWGIRGQLGHWTGAMIPGALLGLAISFLLADKQISRGVVVGLTAAGYGFGAAQTTLQTAGFLMGTNHSHVINLQVAIPGLMLKGGLWALFAGAGLGLALCVHLYRKIDIVLGALVLVAVFYLGWWIIDRPRRIYFSVDRPEIWGGLLLGGIAFLAWMTWRGRTRIPLVVASYAAAAGAIGYPIAVSLAATGIHFSHARHNWWKLAETTFGAFMGAGIALGTWRVKDQLPAPAARKEEGTSPRPRALGAILGAALAAAGTEALAQHALPWIILGSLLWCAAYYSPRTGWHIGVTMTFFGTAANLVDYWSREQKLGHGPILWALLGLATLVIAWAVEGWAAQPTRASSRQAFAVLLWAFLPLSYLITYAGAAVIHPAAGAVAAAGGLWPYLMHQWNGVWPVEIGFTVDALALTWLVQRSRTKWGQHE